MSKHIYCTFSVKKVGNSCSNSGTTGVCAPLDSFCNETTQKCECITTGTGPTASSKVPKSGGEVCVDPDELLIGETCSPGGIGDNCLDSLCRSQVSAPGNNW